MCSLRKMPKGDTSTYTVLQECSVKLFIIMAELADAADSKSADLRVLGVRLPLPAPSEPTERTSVRKDYSARAAVFCCTIFGHIWPELCPNSFSSDAADF